MKTIRLLFAALACVVASVAFAQAYPDRPLRLIIPFPPAGGGDLMGRLLADNMGKRLGQPIVVENRPGSDQIIGTQAMLAAPRDGYTLMLNGDTHLPQIAFQRKLPYDAQAELLPIGKVAVVPLLLIANPNMGARSLKDLIAAAKAKPGQIKAGHLGSASTHHLSFRLMEQSGGISLFMVPYKGTAQTTQAVLGGEIDLAFIGAAAGLELDKAGKAVAIGLTTKNRIAALPNLQTLSEAGLPGFDYSATFYLWGATGIPAANAARLNRELRASLDDPAVKGKLTGAGFEVTPSTPEEAQAQLRTNLEVVTRVVRTAGIKFEE